MREWNPIRCKAIGCRNKTWSDDGACSDRCQLALARASHPSSRGERVGLGYSGPSSSDLLPAPLSAPAVDDLRTALRGGSTYDAGFLSEVASEAGPFG